MTKRKSKGSIDFVHEHLRRQAEKAYEIARSQSSKATKHRGDSDIIRAANLPLLEPAWAEPFKLKSRYSAILGGRASGKSHFFAERLIARAVADPDLRAVCVREVQKSLKFSVKSLIESKIRSLGVSDLFDVFTTEIRRKNGTGIIIFQGMQDHTADSILSLEGFGLLWAEESQHLSGRSLQLLRPTIRAEDSELWFSWNPDQPTDAVDEFFRGESPPDDAVIASVNYDQNPMMSKVAIAEMELDKSRDYDYFVHVWQGGYNVRSQLQVMSGKWVVEEFEPQPDWQDVYFGADWGFANDPTCAVKIWVYDECLWVEFESWAVGLELDDTADRWMRDIPGIENHVVRSDCARPESISHVKRWSPTRSHIPLLTAAEKWAGSVEDGIAHLRSYRQIIIHPRCIKFIEECRLHRYKTNAAGDPLPAILDKFNHCLAPETLVETINGSVRIDQIKKGDMVLTRKGYKKVLNAWVSDRNAQTYKVTTSNGRSLIGTGNHEIFTGDGFTAIDRLQCTDSVLTVSAIVHSQRTNTRTLDAAVASVDRVSEWAVLPEVWDLTVEDEHEFFANGILVHNCLDSARYSLSPLIRARNNSFTTSTAHWGY